AGRAVELPPGRPHLHHTLAVALYRLGRYREAVAETRRSQRILDGRLVSCDLYVLALCHRRLGETSRPRDEFLRALAWRPRDWLALPPAERADLSASLIEALSELTRPVAPR